ERSVRIAVVPALSPAGNAFWHPLTLASRGVRAGIGALVFTGCAATARVSGGLAWTSSGEADGSGARPWGTLVVTKDELGAAEPPQAVARNRSAVGTASQSRRKRRDLFEGGGELRNHITHGE